MSFGFSPSDIVQFVNFAWKVARSLSDEHGAKAEYQEAELQCKGFVDIMDEIQVLDLTNLPKNSRDRIERHSAHARKFVGDFKERISKYEKAMGTSTKRGRIGSAPRKVQWALDAADDLAKFRQSLVPLMHLVHIEISASTFALVTKHVKALPMRPVPMAQSPAPTIRAIGAPPIQNYLDWRRDDTGYQWSLALDIADFVYDRLKSGPGTSIADQGKVYTLPSSNDGEATAEQRASHTDISLQKIGNPTMISSSRPLEQRNSRELNDLNDQAKTYIPSQGVDGDADTIQQGVNIGMSSEKSIVPYAIHTNQAYEQSDHRRMEARNGNEDQNSFLDNINEYLRSLNMPELSESEKELLPGYAESSRRLLTSNGSDSENPGSPNDVELPPRRRLLSNMPDTNAAESPQDFQFPKNHTRKPQHGWRFRMSSFGIDPISAAAAAAGIVSLAEQLSLRLLWYSRDHRKIPREIQSLHEDILRYSRLLELVTGILVKPPANEELASLVLSIVREMENILHLIQTVIDDAIRSNAPLRSLFIRIKWRSARQQATEAFANVKLLMSFALQVHQAQAMQSLQYDTNRNNHLILGNLQALRAPYNEHAARPEESMGQISN